MITITIAGPAKSGKSYLAGYIKTILCPLGDAVVVVDDSPDMTDLSTPMRDLFKGTTIKIITKTVRK